MKKCLGECFSEKLIISSKERKINPYGNKKCEDIIKELDYFIKGLDDYGCSICFKVIDYKFRKEYINNVFSK